MKVFLSWSGSHSNEVAKIFAEWIPCVLQQVGIFMSSNSIESGDRWNNKITSALDETDFGLIFVTKENKEKPWLLFEAGALAKDITKSKVIPVLIDATPVDLNRNPLQHFQCEELDREGVTRVMHSIYHEIKNPTVTDKTLNDCLEMWWPQLEEKLQHVHPPKKRKPSKEITESDRIEKIEYVMSDMLRMMSQIRRNTELSSRENRVYRAEKNTKLSMDMPPSFIRKKIQTTTDFGELLEIQESLLNGEVRRPSRLIEDLLSKIDKRISELHEEK